MIKPRITSITSCATGPDVSTMNAFDVLCMWVEESRMISFLVVFIYTEFAQLRAGRYIT